MASMAMTIDQKINFLHASFLDFDPESLFMILQANQYALNPTLEALFQMAGQALKPSGTTRGPSAQSSHATSTVAPIPPAAMSGNNTSKPRGAPVTLPSDFLRLPHSNQRHQSQNQSAGDSGPADYLTLFSDPSFLAEMEREFGPDFEAVLREHMQAEAMRNTSNYAAYSTGYPEHSQQLPPPPPPQQQAQIYHTYPTPEEQQQQQLRQHKQQQEQQQRFEDEQALGKSTHSMQGISGGESPASSTSTSVSSRFQGILNKFMPQKSYKSDSKGQDSSGLLRREYDEMSDEGDVNSEESLLLSDHAEGGMSGAGLSGVLETDQSPNGDEHHDTASLLR